MHQIIITKLSSMLIHNNPNEFWAKAIARCTTLALRCMVPHMNVEQMLDLLIGKYSPNIIQNIFHPDIYVYDFYIDLVNQLTLTLLRYDPSSHLSRMPLDILNIVEGYTRPPNCRPRMV